MQDFHYVGEELYCENVSLAQLAREVGTPFFLYSHQSLQRRYRAFHEAFADIPHIIAYAVKANSNLAVLRTFAKEGSGADIVSGGELYRALQAGMAPEKIVFAGVGKTRQEIRQALEAQILLFNVESSQELALIDQVAGEQNQTARIALRINPDVDPKTHPYIATGLRSSKFGIQIDQAFQEIKVAQDLKNIEVVGLHIHIGSQLTQIAPFEEALSSALQFIDRLQVLGIAIQYLNIGGGLGITYEDEVPPEPKALAQVLLPHLKGKNYTLILEPGRYMVGNAGALVTRALYTKASEEKKFVIVDAGMNDLIRPSLYDAYHEVRAVNKTDRPMETVDVVGPICESGDFLAKGRELPEFKSGDLMAVMSAGAYGFVMSCNYNARPRPPEVLVFDDEYEIVRSRESYDDLVRGEIIPSFLK